jgi:hypothetical protein
MAPASPPAELPEASATTLYVERAAALRQELVALHARPDLDPVQLRLLRQAIGIARTIERRAVALQVAGGGGGGAPSG